jgi:hypothetical protein
MKHVVCTALYSLIKIYNVLDQKKFYVIYN